MTKKEIVDLKTLGSKLPNYLDNEVISTNIYALDKLLKGGITLGSTMQIVGESGTGKSTTVLCIAKEFCRQGKNVLYIDTEGSVSKEIITSLGLDNFMTNDNQRLYYLRLSTFDEIDKQLNRFISTDEISLVIVDSLAGMINAGYTNLEDGIPITNVVSSYNSRPLGMFMNKYKTLATERSFAFIFTNQYRNKISMTGLNKGTQQKEYGGKNTRHNSDTIIRIDVCNIKCFKAICEWYDKSYSKCTPQVFNLIKSNKNSPNILPFNLVYGKGISDYCSHLYKLKELDIIKQNGTYYSLSINGNEIKENGLSNLLEQIKISNINLYELFKDKLDN